MRACRGRALCNARCRHIELGEKRRRGWIVRHCDLAARFATIATEHNDGAPTSARNDPLEHRGFPIRLRPERLVIPVAATIQVAAALEWLVSLAGGALCAQ